MDIARSPRTRIKICCMASVDEAALAMRHGADALGLVAAMPSGPGVIPEAEIAVIARSVPPGVDTFLLTSHTDVSAIIEQQRRCRCSTLQICDALSRGTHDELRAALPGVRLVQVIHVQDEAAIAAAERVQKAVDAILLDSGRPTDALKTLGGTGQTHDWQVSKLLVQRVHRPVFLAGGLRPENVADAVAAVRPFGVDLCSGVRTDGRLDEAKLAAFMDAVRAADQALSRGF